MAQSYDRRINLYINVDGKEVKNNVKSIRGEMQHLVSEQNQMTIGSEEYIRQTRKIQQLKGILVQHQQDLTATKGVLGGLQDKLSAMPGSLGAMASGIISVGKAAMSFFLTPVGAIIGIIAAIGLGVKSLVTNSIEFGKAASSLSAITGATGKDLDFLKKKAREIAKDSTQNATDMLKAFQTIGSAMPDLLKNGPLLAEVTKNAVMLSESTGGQLAVTDAAKAAAAALNQFNIPLTESARAVNVLAAGSLEGAAEVDNITESLKNLGPVASGANMSLENTVAAVEVLAEKGILGAEAGTKLRGVILKLQGESLGYASGQFNLKDAMDEANKTISEQGTAMEKDAYIAKLFGIENVTAGKIMLENVDKYTKLTEAVTGTNTAFDQARIQQDNLEGSNKKFSGAWKNMMLAIEDGNGILSRSWKGIVDGATWLLNGMTSQFENLGASVRSIVIFFTTFYDQMKTPLLSVGHLLKAVFTLDFSNMKQAFDEFKTSLAKVGKDGSLNIGKIALEQLKLGQASKEATAEMKKQQKLMLSDGNPLVTGKATPIDPIAAKAAADAFEMAYKQQQLWLKERYAGEETLQKEYHARQLANELAYLNAKQALATDDSSYLDLQSQIIDKQNEYTAALKLTVPEILNTDNGIQKLNTRLLEESELLAFAAQKQAEGTAAQEAATAKQKQQSDTIKMVGDAMTDYVTGALNGSIDGFQSFGDTLILMSLQILKQMVPIWSAQILGLSLASPESVATWGAAGMAKFAVITGLMYAGIAAVEGAVKGGIDKKKEAASKTKHAAGGFTHGETTYIAGEAGTEWISPNWMLKNPVTSPFIYALENWRKNPVTVTSAAIEISERFASERRFASGGFTSDASKLNAYGGGFLGMLAGQSSAMDLKQNELLLRIAAALDSNTSATNSLQKNGVQFPIVSFIKKVDQTKDLINQTGMPGFEK